MHTSEKSDYYNYTKAFKKPCFCVSPGNLENEMCLCLQPNHLLVIVLLPVNVDTQLRP